MTITQSQPGIAATGLRKSFGDQVVLDSLDLNVSPTRNLPMPLVLLPFLSSGFVPTDSMPTGLR